MPDIPALPDPNLKALNTPPGSGSDEQGIESMIESYAEQLLEAQDARGIKTPFTEDEIEEQIQAMREHGIPITKEHIKNLEAGRPILAPPPETVAQDPNAWFNASPQVAFVMAFYELFEVLQEVKQMEAEVVVASMNLTMEQAEEIAGLIKKGAYAEAFTHLMSAIAGGVSAGMGVVSMGGGAVGGGLAKTAGKRGGMKGAAGGAMQAGQAAAPVAQGMGQIISGIGGFKGTLEKGEADAERTLREAAQKITERQLSSSSEAFKSADDQISQLLQNLQQLLEKIYRAHDMKRG